MRKEDLCIATITFARNDEEETLLRASLSALAALGVPVFVTDGGSPASFLHFIGKLPNLRLLPSSARGVYAQAKNSLLHAAGTEASFILYTEPDKRDFFIRYLPAFLEEAPADAHTGVVMASRTARGFATFPPFQQMTETAINNCCEERIGLKADYCYGPFLLTKSLLACLNEVKEDIGWGWRPFVFNTAHRIGYAISALEKDFLCPEAQRADDAAERLYRMKQLEQNIRGLVLSAEASGKQQVDVR